MNMTYKRAKILRIKHHRTEQELAAHLGITPETYRSYETDLRNIPVKLQLEIICRLAEFYHTSTDYLLGLKDEE